LDEIHRQHEASRAAHEEAEQARHEASSLETDLENRMGGIEEERRAILEEARLKAEAELETTQEAIAALRRKLATAAQPLEALEDIQTEMDALADKVLVPTPRKRKDAARPSFVFQPGDRVLLRSLGAQGVITDLGSGHAEVQVGRLRVKASLDDLRPPEEQTVKRHVEGPRPRTGISVAVSQAPPLELDLRGQTIDEALYELERRLDASFMAGLPFIRVIHGKGTGKLRQEGKTYLVQDGDVISVKFNI